jgi:hypothetical protein
VSGVQNQTSQVQVITNEEYEVFGYKVRYIFRIDARLIPIVPSSPVGHVVRIIHGMTYGKENKCIGYNGTYHYGLDDGVVAPEGSIVLMEYWDGSEKKYRCGIVENNAEMKIAELGPVVKNIREIDCPSTEEVTRLYADLLNSGFCIDGLHAKWLMMALSLARRLYGIEI